MSFFFHVQSVTIGTVESKKCSRANLLSHHRNDKTTITNSGVSHLNSFSLLTIYLLVSQISQNLKPKLGKMYLPHFWRIRATGIQVGSRWNTFSETNLNPPIPTLRWLMSKSGQVLPKKNLKLLRNSPSSILKGSMCPLGPNKPRIQ